ncbi:MAG: hypothetical protein ACUVQP_10510 [Bacteroidales bacterium]
MESLLPHFKNWFLKEKKKHFTAFAQSDSRIEGWFKAELIVLFNQLAASGVIDKFERKANVPSPKDGKRKRVDFRIHFQGRKHLCELKALCISRAAGTSRNLHFYFRDNRVGLIKDFKKLDEIASQDKWVIAFVYPSPDSKEWSDTAALLPSKLKHWRPVTSLSDFPESAYIALWKG